MAKQFDETGFIEKHIEKLVLAGAGLVFLLVLVTWVTTSPTTVMIDGKEVGPEEIDATLVREVERTRTRIINKPVEQRNVPKWLTDLRVAVANPFELRGPLVPFTTGSRDIPYQPSSAVSKFTEALTMPPLGRTWARAASELIDVPAVRGARGVARDVGAAHIACVLDYGDMVAAWNEEFDRVGVSLDGRWVKDAGLDVWQRSVLSGVGGEQRRPAVMFHQVVTERQELIDGSWTDPAVVPPVGVSQMSQVVLPAWPDSFVFDPKTSETPEKLISPYGQAGIQEQIIEPGYFRVYWAPPEEWPRSVLSLNLWATWRHHLPVTPVNELDRAEHPSVNEMPISTDLKDYVQRRVDARTGVGGAGLGVGFGEGEDARKAVEAAKYTDQGDNAFLRDNYADALASYRKALKAVEGYSEAMDGVGIVKTQQWQETLPSVTKVPTLGNQGKAGKMQIWAHDVSCVPGKTYRYRLTVVMLNPLLGQLHAVDEEHVGLVTKMKIESQSQWSNPVSVPSATQYFLVGGQAAKGAQFEVYRVAFGRLFKEEADVAPGQQIGGSALKRYLDPLNSRTTQATVDFGTGDVLVDVDYEKALQTGAVVRKDVEVIVLTADGRLVTRNALVDSRSTPRKDLQKAAKEADEKDKGGTGTGGAIFGRPGPGGM